MGVEFREGCGAAHIPCESIPQPLAHSTHVEPRAAGSKRRHDHLVGVRVRVRVWIGDLRLGLGWIASA